MISIDYTYLGSTEEEDAERYRKAYERECNGEDAVDDEYSPGSLCVLVVYDSDSQAVAAFHVDKRVRRAGYYHEWSLSGSFLAIQGSF